MDKVFVGKVINSHGIKGEIKILSDFDRKDLLFKKNNKLIINDKEYVINTYRVHKNFDMVTFMGFNNINDILDLIGLNVFVLRSELKLNEDDYILNDLIGKNIILNNEVIGKVIDYDNGINKVLIVEGEKKFYIPLNGNFIKKINNDIEVIDLVKDLII